MNSNKIIREEKDTNIIGQIIFRYVPYWPLFLLLFIMAFATAWFYLKFSTPLYQSTARILIKDEKKGAEDAKTIEELNPLSGKKIIENESQVIQSGPLVNDVVNNLALYAPVFHKGKFRNPSAYTASPIKIEIKNPGAIKEVKAIHFDFDKANSSIVISNKSYPLNHWINAGYGTMKFITNSQYDGKDAGKEFYFSLIEPEKIVASVRSRLKAEAPTKETSIINLSLNDEVPQRGEDILNQLMLAYNKATITDKNTLAANTLVFLDERLKNVQHDLNEIESKNKNYKSQQGAIDIGEQGRLFLQNVSNNDQKLSEINMQVAVLGQVEAYVRSKNTEGNIVPSTLGVTDPLLSQLVSKLYGYELEYESLKKTTAENNPSMLSLMDRIDKIRPSILENIQSQKRSLETSRNNLSATNNNYASIIRSIPEKEKQLVDINREQSIKNGIYSYLLQKREDVALSYASTLPDTRIIDKANSSATPVSPKKKFIYLSSFLIALFLGVAAVSAKETLSRKVMFRYEIEKLTQQPIVGEIASSGSKEHIVIDAGKKTFIAEQFRRLRITLPYIGIGSKRKRILVTSAIAGEGKSFVALNLALSLALTGKKVVLVDCDLNNPSLSSKLGIYDDKGVTQYLHDECNSDEIIKPTTHSPDLFFIPSGKLPANPSELMMNGKIEELLNHLDAAFDYVIVDTAPVIPVTDAYAISPFCDATLFVIRHHYTPKIFIERIDEDNKINHLNNIAIVFNGVRPRGFGRKNYGYGYGYGYIYKDSDTRPHLRISNT